MKKGLLILATSMVIFLGFGQQKSSSPAHLVRTMTKELFGKKRMPPGISIAVMQDGKIVFAEGFGYADLSNKTPVTTKTQFRAASVSKMMTVTALALLVQEKKLDLDAPIQKYIPNYEEKRFPITARALAGHVSGIPHYSSGDSIKKQFYTSVEESLTVFSHLDLLSEPGTEYSYSTHGYTLLSAVIEGASGVPFLDYLKKEVFQPLQMHDSGPDLRAATPANMTHLYGLTKEGESSSIEHPEDPSYKWGGGGMIATPTDLVKLGNAYLNGFIRPATVVQLFTSQKLNSGEETGVGIGWRRSWDMDGRRVYEHAGAMGGARSVISIFPDDSLVVAIMSNTYSPGHIEETAHMIARPFLTETIAKQPRGTWDIDITTLDTEGGKIQEIGQLILDGQRDRIVIKPEDADKSVYPLTYLNSDNVYALAHPYGLLHTEITITGGKIMGRSIRYRSPRLQPPTTDAPFLSFTGQR